MHIEHGISLQPYNTFGVHAIAAQFITANDTAELKEALFYAGNFNLPVLVLGGGSNILLTKDFDGLVIHVNIKGISAQSLDDQHILMSCGAGENWHDTVMYALSQNWGGMENLSLIPGTVGAAPIQNIGAYGVELKSIFHSLEALIYGTLEVKTFNADDCRFGYRDSIFKQELKNKCIITKVNFRLSKPGYHKINTSYGAIQAQLDAMQVKQVGISDVSRAVIAIRQSKLPDPKVLGNAGSFFKNPEIPLSQYKSLLLQFPDMPSYPVSADMVKVPAGWLIEQTGLKGKQFGACGVHKDQALVLVNYGGATGAELLALAQHVQQQVAHVFGITLQMEVNII
jgi:UDP-N-acetylmuramate dehydrogenase